MPKKNPERLPPEMFRSWLRSNTNRPSPTRSPPLIRSETLVGCNDVIIKKILEHVEVQDLFKCRLVNTHWTSIATAHLTRVNTGCSHFQYHFVQKCYIAGHDQQLSALVKCAKKSVKFPTTSFSFRAGDMSSKDAKEFLAILGSSVKTLRLVAVDNASLSCNMNLTTILSHTPNLETLILDGGSYFDATATQKFMLPSLKCIKIDCSVYTPMTGIEMLLNGAINLKSIVAAWRLEGVEPIVNAKKIHTVKSWCPTKYSRPLSLVQLTTATEDELKLNELVVYIHEKNLNSEYKVDMELLWKCVHKILEQNTIRKLILNRSEYPANASFPLNMDKVEELVLMPDSKSKLKHFPVNTNLSCAFPQLNTLSLYDPLYHACCARREWENSFPLSDEFKNFHFAIFPLVTTLNLRGNSSSIRMLRRMKKICPNVQNLEICLNNKMDKEIICRELCGEWRNLKKLSIDLKECNLELKDNFDTAFTGLGPENLKSLNGDRSLTEEDKLRKAEDARDVLWIGNISGLIQLDIEYKVPSSQSKDRILVPFTQSSGLYAFKLMPKLAVNLHYWRDYSTTNSNIEELETAFNSIGPFVKISRH